MGYKVPVTDLMKSLEKAGAPLQGSTAMQSALPQLGNTLTQQAYGADTQLPQIKQNFMKQLEQIAQMDQKLGSVYSDPTSPLYTDNVSAREKIISGAHSTNSAALKPMVNRYKARQSELDDEVKETVDLYKQLTAMQQKEEARAEKLAREEERIRQGKGKYITDSKGNQVLVPVYKGKKSLTDSVKDSLERSAELRRQKSELAGLNEEALDYFDNLPAKFQHYWVENLEDGEVPPEGFAMDEVKNEYEYWVKKFKPETASQIKKGTKESKQLF